MLEVGDEVLTQLLRPLALLGSLSFAKNIPSFVAPSSQGLKDIIEAQQWLRDLERIFSGLEITNAQQQQLAAWQLREQLWIGGCPLQLTLLRLT